VLCARTIKRSHGANDYDFKFGVVAVGSLALFAFYFMKTFTCNFGKGVSCTIRVAETPPEQGKTHIQKFEWSQKPTLKVIRPYVAWINSVNQQLANEWRIKIMHVFQIRPSRSPENLEIWTYEPNGRPTRI